MEFFASGESIECQSAEIVAKKIILGAITENEILGTQLRKYSCQRDGYAEIVKELDPKTHKLKPSSRLDQGNKLKCKRFFFLVERLGSLKIKKVKFSGDHNAQHTQTNDFTFAEIAQPFDSLVRSLAQNNPGNQKEIKRIGK